MPVVSANRVISYAQRFEDLYLMRCFEGCARGFYVDIGSGHPVYDNVSFAFYLKGWSGITVEPNPWLARLTRAVRRRDYHVEALVGARPGQAKFYLVRDFHGLSTTIEHNARAALKELGKESDELVVPVTTLGELCATHGLSSFEFLKIDVEGAENDVLLGNDWQRFRPKVIVVEALAPHTLAPAWDAWEPILIERGYAYAWFDGLNRYYVAAEAAELARCFETAPTSFDAMPFQSAGRAIDEKAHPDHLLATLLAEAAMIHLPVFDRALLLELLTAGVPDAELNRRADETDVAPVLRRTFGPGTTPDAIPDFKLPAEGSIRDLYAALADTDQFRVICGRISAGYRW